MVEMMRAAPAVPKAAKGLPFLRTIIGEMVVRIRLPGFKALTPPFEKFRISLLRMIPVPAMAALAPKKSESVCVRVTMFPLRSTTHRAVVLSLSRSFWITRAGGWAKDVCPDLSRPFPRIGF